MRYRPKRENYAVGQFGEIDYQEMLERYCTYVENQNKQLPIADVVSSSDLIVVELADEEIKIITRQELEQWKQSAIEFDGFEGWIVRGQLVKGL